MPHLRVIGIAGKARSGKDTIAAFLLQLGVARYRYAFADPIRAMLKAGLGIDMDDPDQQRRKEESVPHLGRSRRYLMQTLGTEWGRELVHPDIWLKAAHYVLLERGPGMVISDVRFDNEAQWIREQGGLVIHVSRRSAPLVGAHASEDGVAFHPGRDELIDNNSDVPTLRGKVAALFHERTRNPA